jgi:hypothetical protein
MDGCYLPYLPSMGIAVHLTGCDGPVDVCAGFHGVGEIEARLRSFPGRHWWPFLSFLALGMGGLISVRIA